MNPVEDVCGMEPPSSDAEALRNQETAQVRAADGLLVAADEFCDLEGSHQSVGQSAASARGVDSASRDFGSMRRIRVRRLAHRFLRTAVASNALFDAGFNGDEP